MSSISGDYRIKIVRYRDPITGEVKEKKVKIRRKITVEAKGSDLNHGDKVKVTYGNHAGKTGRVMRDNSLATGDFVEVTHRGKSIGYHDASTLKKINEETLDEIDGGLKDPQVDHSYAPLLSSRKSKALYHLKFIRALKKNIKAGDYGSRQGSMAANRSLIHHYDEYSGHLEKIKRQDGKYKREKFKRQVREENLMETEYGYVDIHKPGHRDHGKRAWVFHKHADGRLNVQVTGYKKKTSNYTINKGEWKNASKPEIVEAKSGRDKLINIIKKQIDPQRKLLGKKPLVKEENLEELSKEKLLNYVKKIHKLPAKNRGLKSSSYNKAVDKIISKGGYKESGKVEEAKKSSWEKESPESKKRRKAAPYQIVKPKSTVKISVTRPIGHTVSDIGPGRKEYNKKTYGESVNNRELATKNQMHKNMAKIMQPYHTTNGGNVDYYHPSNGDKKWGKVVKNDGNEVHIQDHGFDKKIHKFKIVEGAMPSSVIKHKEKLAGMAPDELHTHFKRLSSISNRKVEDLARAAAWRHGYGKNSPKYWDKIKHLNEEVLGEDEFKIVEGAKKGLYYYVNKRKKAGTSRDADNPKAPTAQAWKDAAKTAKTEGMVEKKRTNSLNRASKAIDTFLTRRNRNRKREMHEQVYPVTYMKMHKDPSDSTKVKHVELHHASLDLGEKPGSPERTKHLIKLHPKHKELINKGYKVDEYGKHKVADNYYSHPVKVTK